MDPLYTALSLYRRKHYEKCADVCSVILDKHPLDQAAWCLKMRAMTQQVYVDDIDSEDAAEAECLNENVLATAPRPGTSFKPGQSGAMGGRPRTSTGRPISGVARPGSQGRPGSSALDRVRTARPLTSHSARAIRLGTAAMLTQQSGPFIQLSRLNIGRYARDKCLSKALFEYVCHYEGDLRVATELCVQATEACAFGDWWWKAQLARCYLALSLPRDAEQQLRSALKQLPHLDAFIRMVRVCARMDQPLSAVEVCRAALAAHPGDVAIHTQLARINERLGQLQHSVRFYRSVLIEDAMNTEAIACIAVYHFYNHQPELALRYFRRILAMGAHSAELYNNLALCCLHAQQLDLVYVCFQRALDLATNPLVRADVWFNLSHLAISSGDVELTVMCLNLCVHCDPQHAPAFNNLGVLQHRLGRPALGKAYLATASALQPDLEEARANLEHVGGAVQ